MWPHWINIVISFIAIFLGVRHNIKKDRYPKAMIIFFSLFVIEQILAYSIGIDVLKINRANEDNGTTISIISILLPLLLGFIIDNLIRKKSIQN